MAPTIPMGAIGTEPCTAAHSKAERPSVSTKLTWAPSLVKEVHSQPIMAKTRVHGLDSLLGVEGGYKVWETMPSIEGPTW